jgi:hypothetical protein
MIRMNSVRHSSLIHKLVIGIDRPTLRSLPRRELAVKWISTTGSSSLSDLQAQGLVDDNRLTIFKTLHELQDVACRVYPENELFGTFNEESGKFEFMTYQVFGRKVEECRAVLQHLGECDH